MPAAQQRRLADVDDGRPLRSLAAGFAGKRTAAVRIRASSLTPATRWLPGPGSRWWASRYCCSSWPRLPTSESGSTALSPPRSPSTGPSGLTFWRVPSPCSATPRRTRAVDPGHDPAHILVLSAGATWASTSSRLVVAAAARVLFGDQPLSEAVRATLHRLGAPLSSTLLAGHGLLHHGDGDRLRPAPAGEGAGSPSAGVGALVLVLFLSRIYLGLDNVTGDVPGALIGSGVAAPPSPARAGSQYPVTCRRRGQGAPRADRIPGPAHRRCRRRAAGPCTDRDHPLPVRRFGRVHAVPAPGGGQPRASSSASSTPPPTCARTAGTSYPRSSATGGWRTRRPFSSVRRLVEHEDYMLRLLRDGGVASRAARGSRRSSRGRVPAGHRVGPGRGGDPRADPRRGRRRRAAAGPPAVAGRRRPPGHQAVERPRAGRT